MSGGHDFEPTPGLPGLLPRGERVLWQGRPGWVALARGPYLGDLVALYFLGLMGWRFVDTAQQGHDVGVAFGRALWLAPVAVVALALIAGLAWIAARTAVYTITNRRVVLRVGMALTLTLNVPFRQIAAAGLRPLAGGKGEIKLTLAGTDSFSYFALWPHARPWKLGRAEPMLRALPDAGSVAALLSDALRAWHAAQGASVPALRTVRIPAAPQGGLVAAE